MSRTLIRTDNLTKRFKLYPKPSGRLVEWLSFGHAVRHSDFWALRGASFSIRRGEILGLIGPNGSGKTTLFQCFAGIAPATLGVVERDATRVAPDDRKRLLFFVPDGVRPWTDQSVAWTLRFIAGVPPFKVGICLAGT